LGGKITTQVSSANFGTNPSNASSFTSIWRAQVNPAGTETQDRLIIAKRIKWTKTFGINSLKIDAIARYVFNVDSGSWSRTNNVRLRIDGVSGTTLMPVPSTSFSQISGTLDVSGLGNGNQYDIIVEIYVELEGSPANDVADTAEGATILREDFDVSERTESA